VLVLRDLFHDAWLSGHEHNYDDVRGEGFFGQTRRERRAYPSGVCKERATKSGRKELPPEGLRRIWPVAALLVGHRSTSGYAPSSRLAAGQIRRNERHRNYVHDHLVSGGSKRERPPTLVARR